MTDITCLSIPKELIKSARDNEINCSDICRKALTAEINKKLAAAKGEPEAPIVNTPG